MQMQTMRALVKQFPERGLILDKEVPVPKPKPNEVLIKVHKTAICGTDVHIYEWNDWAESTIQTPMIIGHEYVGEVVGFGGNVASL
jgi:threonine 3-dehydrogenase